MNNFQKLEAKNMAGFSESERRIKKQFERTRELYQLIGNMVDLYFPGVVGTVNGMLRADKTRNIKNNKKK